MIRKIALGYDGSESSKNALEFALDLAAKFRSELHVLAASRPPEFGTEVETEAIVEQSREHFLSLLEPVKKRMADTGTKGVCEVLVGHPAEQIIRYSEQNGVDHIVVGHRGHTLFERWLIGSVARQVVAYSHCAVTVVRK
jgi:nucleotide-binding universal stress UspA family protein